MSYFIDTHAHLNFPRFDNDRETVIQTFQALGVKQVINVATNLDTTIDCIDLARKYPDEIFATVGLHPHYANEHTEESFKQMVNYAKESVVVGIGEIGLDYFRNPVSPDVQKKVFCSYLSLAVDVDLPVIIHCRDAFEDCKNILKDFLPLKAGGEFHCYTGDLNFAKWLVSQGIMVAFNGIVTYKNAPDMQEVASLIDSNYFLLETDCPYLAPQSKRSQRNDPSNIPEIASKIAQLRGVTIDEIARLTTANAKRLFFKTEKSIG